MKNEFFNGNGILERNKIQLVQTLLQFEDILLSPVQIQSLLDGSIKEKINEKPDPIIYVVSYEEFKYGE